MRIQQFPRNSYPSYNLISDGGERLHHAGLKEPRMTAIAECCAIMGCGTFSLIFGILTLVFLNDPEVAAYYRKKQLEG